MNKKKLVQIILIITLVALPAIALAQVQLNSDLLKPAYAPEFNVSGGNRASVANVVLQLIAGSLIYAAGPLAVLILAFGGLRYVTSHGDQTQMEEAKKTITWAIIGLLVIIVSWALVVNIIRILQSTGG